MGQRKIKVTKDIEVFGRKIKSGITVEKVGTDIVYFKLENDQGESAMIPFETKEKYGKTADEFMDEIETLLN